MSKPPTSDRRWKLKPCIKCSALDWMYGHRKLCSACWTAKATMPDAVQKRNAQFLAQEAVRNGVLVRQPCVACAMPSHGRAQDFPSQGHHEDYSKPLEVIWLCPMHHRWVHEYGVAFVLGQKQVAA